MSIRFIVGNDQEKEKILGEFTEFTVDSLASEIKLITETDRSSDELLADIVFEDFIRSR